MYPRQLRKTIKSLQRPGFINLIYGPRRIGKSTLIKEITTHISPFNLLWINGDLAEDRLSFETTSLVKLQGLLKMKTHLVVDEAQQIDNIGATLKIIVDHFPDLTIYVTGSSSLSLQQNAKSSLTGRHQTFYLYPLTTTELSYDLPPHQTSGLLETQLLYGGYPYLQRLTSSQEKITYLKTLINDYLFQDLYNLTNINKPKIIEKLATLLAFQIGSQVSFNELANQLGIDVKTVQSYIELLKQIFVIVELPSFSTNQRNELKHSKKYYFLDLGIRNALSDSFQSLSVRPDIGALWENFLILERIKQNHYQNWGNSYYFFRTYTQQEIDLIETKDNQISAYEFKWRSDKAKLPKSWQEHYPQSSFALINQNNYLDSFVR